MIRGVKIAGLVVLALVLLVVVSVGVGIRWVSPVGPIRLDLAHALEDPGGVRLHFSMGPEL